MRKRIWESWAILNWLAFVFSLAHLFIDFQVGVFGSTSSYVSPRHALNICLLALSYAVWGYAVMIAKQGNKAGLITAVIFSAVQAAVLTGLFGLIFVPPPAPAFPYQDLTHIFSLVFGALGAVTTWKQYRAIDGSPHYALPLFAVGLMVANAIVAVPLIR